jgi:hypothetical protein
MMMIGTILAILNAISLIFKDSLLLSWSWVLWAYAIEIGFYFLCLIFWIFMAWNGEEFKTGKEWSKQK